MPTVIRLIALFLLFIAMNMLWQFPIVALPLIGEPQPLIVLSALLQPWLILVAPLFMLLPDGVGDAIGRAIFSPSLQGASLPIAAIFSLGSVGFYYACYRLILRISALRRLASRIPALVPLAIYFLLLSVYLASCVYVVVTITRRLNALG